MKKKYMTLWAIFLALVFFPSMAFPWGSATHAYIDDRIGKKEVLKNMNEIYGGMAPDVFNYMFDNPAYMSFLSYQTHNEFMKVWKAARFVGGKALAYGFVSHNDMWGADSTAHYSCITCGEADGYAYAKAGILKGIIERDPTFGPLYKALGIPDPVALEVFHNLVENGTDILMKRIDPLIGQKIISSALFRSPEFPLLLVEAYAKDFSKYFGIRYIEAVNIITSSEKEFRKNTILYGQALTQDEVAATQLISEQMAELAKSYLAVYGITIPEGVDLTPLIKFTIEQSMEICTDDFYGEIAATINFVNQQLILHRVSY